MSDMGTAITYERVRLDAKTIKECASVMRGIFDDFGNSMNRIGAQDVYEGDAGETLGQKFNTLKGKFDSYIKLVNEFADTITGASEQTAATERELSAEADNLAN